MLEISNIHQHSCFSFQDGVCTPEEIVAAAKAQGLKSIALTDHGHCHGHGRMFLEAKKQGVRALLGMEAYVIDSLAEWREMKQRIADEKEQDADDVEIDLEKAAKDKANRKALYRKGHLVLLAQNRKGLANIYKLQYLAHKVGYYQKPRIDHEMIASYAEGVIASSACMGGVISAPISQYTRGELEWSDVIAKAEKFREIFNGRFFLELQSNEAKYQQVLNEHLVKIHRETKIPLIVTMDAHYVDPADWQSQQILHMLMTHRAGGQGLTFGNLPETYSFDCRSLYVKSAKQLWDQFRSMNPEVPEDLLASAFENTLAADSLIEDFEPDTSMRLPSLPYENTLEELVNITHRGLKARNLEKDDRYAQRLLYELEMIADKGLANYFLIVREICEAARKEMLIGPGRGSSAGSLICYLSGITNIDPIEHNLMFERFINPDRIEVPDIDLDFQDVDRVKDLLRTRFGQDNVACISTYGTSQIKGLLKDLCRVHGIDHSECNKANAAIEKELKVLLAEGETRSALSIKLEDVYRNSPTFNAFVARYPQIEHGVKSLYGREHHVGRHASGVVIGDDLPAETSVFTSKGVVQTSFTDGIVNKVLSQMGLVKFDILGLATLKVIDYCCKLIAERNDRDIQSIIDEIDPAKIDYDDERVLKTVFWDGNMTGIFQVTSKGMERLYQRVKPTCFADVAAVPALYRPGPLESGMDTLYADRKNGIEVVEYDHPILEEILKETYGTFVYQEQILEMGRRLGKLSWGDTNRLRKLFLKRTKDAAGKRDSEAEELEAKLTAGFKENGMSDAWCKKTWDDLSKWARYGFNAAHAKAYGMITFQTAYLRTYYPLEFFAALLSVGQAADLQTYVSEIRKQGFNILPVDVNMSKAQHVLEGNSIRLALGSIKGVGAAAVKKIVDNQPYEDWYDFLLRSGSNKTVCDNLMAVGALSEISGGLSIATQLARHMAYRADKKLSQKKNRDLVRPTLDAMAPVDDDPIDLMQRERELLGFNLRGTPFSIKGRWEKIDSMVRDGTLTAANSIEALADEDNQKVILPLVLKSLKTRPQKNGKMFAFLKFADRDGGEIEAPCFANIWQHIGENVRVGEVYVVLLSRREDDPSLLVVGSGGWSQTREIASMYVIPLDQLEV